MIDPPKVFAARIEVERTRAALLDTAKELQQRLQPKSLANEAWEKAKIKGADLAEDAVDAVKKRPVAVGGVVAALTMFLAREPIKDAVVNLYDAMTSSKEPKRKAAALKAKDKPAPPPARRRARLRPGPSARPRRLWRMRHECQGRPTKPPPPRPCASGRSKPTTRHASALRWRGTTPRKASAMLHCSPWAAVWR